MSGAPRARLGRRDTPLKGCVSRLDERPAVDADEVAVAKAFAARHPMDDGVVEAGTDDPGYGRSAQDGW